MDPHSEQIYTGIFFISFLSAFFTNMLYAPINKLLRDKSVYFTVLSIAIVMLVVSSYQIKPHWEEHEKVNAFAPLIIISYLLFFKLADLIAIKIYNRPLYFSCRLSRIFGDQESEDATFLEFVIQTSILMFSFLIWWLIGEFMTRYII